MLTIDYIGSKKSLLSEIDSELESIGLNKSSRFGDLFAGTGIVSHFVSKKYGCKVLANDLLYYSYIISSARLTKYSKIEIQTINSIIDTLNRLPPVEGAVTKNFCPPSRMYFTSKNGKKIDAVRQHIEQIKKDIPTKIFIYLLASLLSAADYVSNTSAVYTTYLKKIKKKARNPLLLKYIDTTQIVPKSATVHNTDASNIHTHFDLVYLDPPYNDRHYSDHYHVMNTIALHNNFDLKGISGLPANIKELRSDYSRKKKVAELFNNLVKSIHTKHILLSYNNEGLMSLDTILNILNKYGKTSVRIIPYKKFKSHPNPDKHLVTEYLIQCKKY
jgi:adenine-specific DNA-methyltransferase